jgi:formylglycine-generating enzyme required for sulfatase activity
MDSALQALLKRLDHLSEQFRELKEGVHRAIRIADEDPEMALTRARKVLEYIIREIYQRRLAEPPGTRPLENLLQRLVKEGYFPDRLNAYANTIRQLGNVGTHSFGEKVTVTDVYQSLSQLMPILEWYFETERPDALGRRSIPANFPEPKKHPPVESMPIRSEARIAIVPKGLRSFDANDANFFLQLLPGPRDEHGLPDSIRFWKHRIEEKDEPTFTVGVIYGASGCGKSSLVKAGLIPQLAPNIAVIYVEATAEDAEARLLRGLRKRCPELSGDRDLAGTLSALHHGPSQKVLLVLDQFEQWLHANRSEVNSALVQALRQCDAEHIQCLLLVRDDFWMALTRLMAALQIELVQGQNCAAVDLFDLTHSRHVLNSFGRAFGRLSDPPTQEQETFLERAIDGLAQDGRVISVRLALFAEMVKGRPWTPATLKQVGGTEGVGVTFLEETFTASTAPPQHRIHQRAAQAVLKTLLPEAGTDIKGHLRSQAELLEVSGYRSRPRDFVDLLRILDGEIRLITPTDPEGKEAIASQVADAGEKYYQLTHDYLVPSLREWLTRKQKETRRGRAGLVLAERTAVWNARPENRQLPSLLQWFQIRLLTQKKDWTLPQRKMMRKATRYHTVRGLVIAALLAFMGGVTYERHGWVQAHALRDRLLDANINEVPNIVQEMVPYRWWLNPLLNVAHAQAEKDHDASKQLHTSLALLPVDTSQLKYVSGRLLDAEPGEVSVLRNALAPHKDELVNRLWAVVYAPEKGKQSQRLRAAAALAKYDPENQRWAQFSALVVKDLVRENPVYLLYWSGAFRPVKSSLLAPLADVFRDRRAERASERSLATNLLADYAADNPPTLADLLMDADENQFAEIFAAYRGQGEKGLAPLTGEIDQKLPVRLPSSDEKREKLAKRQANAAVALLRLGQPGKVWPLLRHSSDPRTRSYLIHRLGPLGADAGAVVHRLDEEPDVTIRRALLLSLGEFDDKALPADARHALLPNVQAWYRTDPDPGLHATAEWLLRTWQQEEWLKQVNDGWAKDTDQRQNRLDSLHQLVTRDKSTPAQWYVNGQGQTMVMIPSPGVFLMGSPKTEVDREGGPEARIEVQQSKRIGRSFSIAAHEVTVAQFLCFRDHQVFDKVRAPTPCHPANLMTWYDAAAYCNWLSEREGVPKEEWCYEPNHRGEYAEGMKLAPDCLHRIGYRLPTEAEWEYACRAGASTERYFGETEELLEKYACYSKNSLERWMLRGGSLKPNDFGLFDMYGNAVEWCQDQMHEYPPGNDEKPSEDREQEEDVIEQNSRILRGGSFDNHALILRSACRCRLVPSVRFNSVGFRPARTIRP